jgi:AcrR family transcriptional regulator
VVELGFRGTTMTAIAERAGVTWGAMQHQFGDKDAILDAVLEEALVVLEDKISDVGSAPVDPVQRLKRFTTRAGELMRGRSYRAYLEIQLNRSRGAAEAGDQADWGRHVAGVLDRAWTAAFGDLGLTRRALAESQRVGFVVLAGMATERMLFPEVDRSRQQLSSLRDTLLRIFGVDAP